MKRRQQKQIESRQTKKAKIEARFNDPICLLKEFSTLLKNSEDTDDIRNLGNLKILFQYIVSQDSGFKNHYTNSEGWKHTYAKQQTCWRYFSTTSWAKTWAKTWARIIQFITQFYDQNPDTKVNDCKYCLGEKAGEFRVNIQELADTCCFSQLKHSCIVHYGNVIVQIEDLCKDCKEIFKTNFMSKRKHLKKLSCQLAQQAAKNRLDLKALKKKQKQRMKELAEKMRQKETPAKKIDMTALVSPVVRLRQTMRLCQINWESSRFSPSLNILETVTKEYLGALMEITPGDTKQEEELLSVSRRFVELWRRITIMVGLENMAPEADYLVTLADMFMSSSPSSSLHQVPSYLVSLAAKSGSSDTSNMMAQRLAPQLSDRVKSEKLERCFIVKNMTPETKQFFIKDYFKRLILDTMNENVARDANKLSEQTSSKAGNPVPVAAPAPAPAPVQLPVAVAPAPVQSAPLQQAPAPVHIAETAWINEDTFEHDDVENGLTDPLGESANDDEEYYDEDDVNEEDEKDVEDEKDDEEFTQLADYGLLMDKDGKLLDIH